MERGYCLVSQQIRDKIAKREITVNASNLFRNDDEFFEDDELEKRVQPASFEPVIGDEAFILDIEEHGIFSPGQKETVYRALLKLPKRQRQKIDISNGFEFKTRFNYLIPLEERVILKAGERVKSSPKSSTGRLFPLTRLIADYSSYFDEVICSLNLEDKSLELWLLVQPTAFNLIMHPGLTLNQLRFFNGLNVSLTQEEIVEEFKKNPLLYNRGESDISPAEPVITDDGLQINLDLSGRFTHGIVALRARRNPIPIDLTKPEFYNAEDFFEPVESKEGKIKLQGNEHYLIASKGIVSVPRHLSAEVRRHYGAGIRGTWDEAGFADPGFEGDLVFEATPTEIGGITLSKDIAKPVSALEFFRTSELPDKVYGKDIGSHYQAQLGPKVSKHFKPFDYARAAKEYKKLKRDVLVQDARVLLSYRKTPEGFEPIREDVVKKLFREIEEIERSFFHSRYDCEDDELVLQVIPYVLAFGPDNNIFTYIRATNIEDYGDVRLFGKYSIGLGGHIVRNDAPKYIRNCLVREVTKEEARIYGKYSPPKLVGTMMAYEKPVDRVHFGLVYTMHVEGRVRANEKSITPLGMKSFRWLSEHSNPFETWSKILIPYLSLLYKQ